jgi:LAO/AO transport system kinase
MTVRRTIANRPAPKLATNEGEDIERLAAPLLSGDRRALARAITLVESTRPDHRAGAEALLARLMPATGGSIRLGITGVPGVGKSTFIETFGLHVIARGHRLAVLAVDPSSKRGGGSILGDKTRMEKLATAPEAFIRPSPAGRTLGGVARRTREAILLAEAAGFDVVIVETVGVGQSETAVADMVDMFILLLQPAGGDELQGLKRGIMEVADLLVVNKADGELVSAANRAAADYRRALQLIMPRSLGWRTPVRQCSALTGKGIPEVWEIVEQYRRELSDTGEIAARRGEQARAWLESELADGLLSALRGDARVGAVVAELEAKVAAGLLLPTAAAQRLLDAFRSKSG